MRGLANGNYKHGRYAQDLPTQLAARAAQARSNPQLLSLADDIALWQARLGALLAQVQEGTAGVPWKALTEADAAFEVASRTGDTKGMDAALRTMRQLIHQGRTEDLAWEGIAKASDALRKHVLTEVKTLQSLNQMVTVAQLQLHLGAVTNVVVDACERFADVATKRKLLRYVLAEFTKLSTLEERPDPRNVTPQAPEETRG